MKTLQQIKDEVTNGDKKFVYYNNQVDEIAKRYARECCKSSLEKAANTCIIANDNMGRMVTEHRLITNEENIVLP